MDLFKAFVWRWFPGDSSKTLNSRICKFVVTLNLIGFSHKGSGLQAQRGARLNALLYSSEAIASYARTQQEAHPDECPGIKTMERKKSPAPPNRKTKTSKP